MLNSKKSYKYQILLKEVTGELDEGASEIEFDIVNHDDLFKLLHLIQGKMNLNEAHEKSFFIGLKMAGEVIMRNAQNPLIKKIKKPMAEIMMTVKDHFRTEALNHSISED